MQSSEANSKVADIPTYRLIFFLSIVLSLIGIVVGVLRHSNADGQRGGALADMIALYTLFVRHDDNSAYRVLSIEIPAFRKFLEKFGPLTDAQAIRILALDLEAQAASINMQLKDGAERQETQNFWLAWTTVVGTLFWGFGDLPTQWLINHFSSCF